MTDLREAVERAVIKALKPQVLAVASLRTEDATLPRVVIEANSMARRIPGTAIFDVGATLHIISPIDGGLADHKARVAKVLEKLFIDGTNNEAEAAAGLSDDEASFKALILEGMERELQDREIQDRINLQVVVVPS